jgi:hypothetical protein
VNLTLTFGVILLTVVGLAIAIEMYRLSTARRRRLKRTTTPPRRVPHLERRMLDAFSGPRATYGDCFARYSIWRQPESTRMDVSTQGPWAALNLFTRSLIVRHLWRTLEKLSQNTVTVHVDAGQPGAMLWTAASTAAFDDGGKLEPWAPVSGRAGTLMSGG